jgi:excisionase family DNA binding protein
MDQSLLKTSEAAQFLRRSPQSVRNYIRAGVLPAIRLQEGGRLLIRREDLDKLVSGGKSVA